MKLWIIQRADTEVLGWDENCGVVVVAENEEFARRLAAKECGDEGSDTWLDTVRTNCTELVPGDTARVVLVDYKAG